MVRRAATDTNDIVSMTLSLAKTIGPAPAAAGIAVRTPRPLTPMSLWSP